MILLPGSWLTNQGDGDLPGLFKVSTFNLQKMKMKKYLLVSILVLVMGLASAQTKPKQEEQTPTQNETDEMIKEVQKELDNVSPEDKKAMEDMGVKLPSLKEIPKLTDQQLQNGSEMNDRIVPKMDDKRIASISKTPLTNATLPGFLSETNKKVVALLKQQSQAKGEEIYQLIKTQHSSVAETGNAATGLWMMGKVELAIYVLGKSCKDDPSNTNNLNNYAAMLSMAGAEQLSIPILNNLNKRFPKNSTILNNIGQAWFGLGDISKSKTYLDSTIRIYANHPQANFTKSFIEESEGNKQGAIDAAKCSIKSGYSTEKENRLYKLGYDLEPKDLYWDMPMPQDPLGLEKFKQPDYPENVDQSVILEKDWNEFVSACENAINGLKDQEKQLEAAAEAASQQRKNMLLQAGKNGLKVDLFPRLASKAVIKLKPYMVDGDEQYARSLQMKNDTILKVYNVEIPKLKDELEVKLHGISEKYNSQFGEGKPNPFVLKCADENQAKSNYLYVSNTMLKSVNTDYLNFLRRMLNDKTYYCQYTIWPEDFEVEKIQAKIKWLGTIYTMKPQFQAKCIDQAGGDLQPKPFKLQDFDDVHCEYHSELKLPLGKINVDCSRVTSELDLKFIKFGLKQNMEKGTNDGTVMENFADQFMTCSVEVGASESAGFETEVLKAEASVGVAMRAEFDRTGLTDVILKAEAGVGLGTKLIEDGSMAGVGVHDLSVEAGVEGQISLVSGKTSVESTGVLEGVFKK